MGFKKAERKAKKLRMFISGPSGSGETYSALSIATGLVPGARIAVIDTERGSASLYSGYFNFDTLELESFSPEDYIKGINEAITAGYDVLIIDSMSHAWEGVGGVLDQVNRKGGNTFVDGWGKVGTPLQNRFIDAILKAPLHVIGTMRVKTEYAVEKDDRGKSVPKRVGLKEIQRSGVEYEADILGVMDNTNVMVIEKTRMFDLAGAIIEKPGAKLGQKIAGWLNSGDAPEPKQTPTTESVTTNAPAAPKPAAPAAPKPPAPTTKPASAPSSPKTNGTMREAPVLRAALVAFASRTPVVAGEQFVKNAMASLHNLVRGDETKRKAIMHYMFGKDSGNDLTAGECMALTQWIGMSKTNNEWAPAAMAITEANALLREIEKELGQQEMPF